MRLLASKWYIFLLFFLIFSGSYLYIKHSPWTAYWLDGKEFWYQLLWKGKKVGFVQVSYHFQNDGKFQVSQFTRVATMNRAENLDFTEKEILTFDTSDSGQLVAGFYQRQQGDYFEQSRLENINGQLQGEKQINDQKTGISLDPDGFALSEYLQLMSWARQKPLAGESIFTRRIDLGDMTLNRVTYRVLDDNKMTDRVTVVFQEQNRDWDGIAELSFSGTPTRFYVDQLVDQQLVTKDNALQNYTRTDYYTSQIIRINKPLGDVEKLKRVVLSSSLLADYRIIRDKRQHLDEKGDLHLSDNKIARAFREGDYKVSDKTVTLQQEADELHRLALRIVGNSLKTEEKVKKLLYFVSSYLKESPVIRPMTITGILEQRKGDCTEHTQLFNALARTLSIPAREAEGLVYLGDDIQGFGGHVWSEVVIDKQWVAVDPTWNLIKLTATHIQFSKDDKNSIFDSMHKNSRLSFNLVEVDYWQ